MTDYLDYVWNDNNIIMNKHNINQKLIDNLHVKSEKILPMIISKSHLSINVKIKNHTIEALLDTGAEACTITYDLVKFLDIEEAIDKNYKGIAHGIGQTEIVGIIPYINIKFNNKNYPISFTVINQKMNPDILIGLNFMMFNNCIIDLKNSKLVFNDEQVSFNIRTKG